MNLPSHPAAWREADDAIDWYAARSPRTGVRFTDAIDRAVDDIAANPRMYPLADDAPPGDEVRNLIMSRFPYRVVYLLNGTQVVIVAVAHTSRPPGYWHSRLAP
jgi:plasmid stabilization system protein ParE